MSKSDLEANNRVNNQAPIETDEEQSIDFKAILI